MRKHIVMLAWVILLASIGMARAEDPQRHAVVIGINDYADPAIDDLKYAESDAKAVYETVTDTRRRSSGPARFRSRDDRL